jgi:hypothetical protein
MKCSTNHGRGRGMNENVDHFWLKMDKHRFFGAAAFSEKLHLSNSVNGNMISIYRDHISTFLVKSCTFLTIQWESENQFFYHFWS